MKSTEPFLPATQVVCQNLNSLIPPGNEIEVQIRWVISSVLLAAIHALLHCLLKARSIFENTHVLLFHRNLMTIVSLFLDFSPVDMLINDSLKDSHRNTNPTCMENRDEKKLCGKGRVNNSRNCLLNAHMLPDKFSPCEKLKSRTPVLYLFPSLSLVIYPWGRHSPIILWILDILFSDRRRVLCFISVKTKHFKEVACIWL